MNILLQMNTKFGMQELFQWLSLKYHSHNIIIAKVRSHIWKDILTALDYEKLSPNSKVYL